MMFLRGYGAVHGCYGFLGGGMWMMLGLIVIIGIIVYLVLRNNKTQPLKSSSNAHAEALDLLKLQYVKGEITEEEYLKRKRVLEL